MDFDFPWISAKDLIERWDLHYFWDNDKALSRLHQAINFLELPAYNSDYELYEINTSPLLLELAKLAKEPKYVLCNYQEAIQNILARIHFKMDDVKKFEAKYRKNRETVDVESTKTKEASPKPKG